MKHCPSLVTGLLLCAHGSPVLATSTQTDPIIVTATRLDSADSTATNHTTIISAAEIRQSSAATLPELLSQQAGINSRSLFGNNAARVTVDIRGFGATATQNTLLLLDGRRLNDVDLSAVDYAALPLNNIERIEITRGTGAVLYGDGAVGGTINIITKQSDRMGSTGYIEGTYGAYDSGSLQTALSHNDGQIAFNLAASALTSDGYRDNNQIDQKNIQGTLRLLQDNGEVYIRLGADEQDLRTPGGRSVNPSAGLNELTDDRRGTNNPNDFANQDGRYISAGVSHYLNDKLELILDTGYRKKNQQAFLEQGGFPQYIDTDLSTWSLTPRLNISHAFGDHNASTQVGIDYYDSNYNSYRGQTKDTINQPIHTLDVGQQSTAMYARNTTQLSDHSTLTLGARRQSVDLSASDNFDATAPGGSFGSEAADLNTRERENMYEAGLRQQLSQTTALFVTLGRSARFGSIDEIFELDPNTYVQLFSALNPQTARNTEVGFDYTSGGFRAVTSLYHMRLEDEIYFDPTSFTNINLDPTRRYGLEASASTQLSQTIHITTNLAYTRAEFREGTFKGNDIPLVPRYTASLSGLWDINPTLEMAASLNYIGDKYFDNDQANAAKKIPAYETLDIKLTNTQGPWRISAAINNALGKKAFDYGVISTFTPGKYNAYPLPERSWIVSLTYDFD